MAKHTNTSLMISAALLTALAPAAMAKNAFTVQDLNELDQVHDVIISPDQTTLVYGHKEWGPGFSLEQDDLWSLSLLSPNAKPKRITTTAGAEHSVSYSKDGRWLYFLADRTGSTQLWRLNLQGGEAQQVTDLPLDIEGYKLSPENDGVVMTMTVYPGCETLQCTLDKMAKEQENTTGVKAYDQLFARHWDHWKPETRSHLFYFPLPDTDQIKSSQVIRVAKDLMPHWDTDVPAKPFSGMEEVTFTPDGQSIVFSAKEPSRDQAWTTNFDLFQVSINGGEKVNLTPENKAWDSQPRFSADGRFMAWAAMKVPGYEADRFGIMLKDLRSGAVKEVSPLWELSAGSFEFSDDNRSLIVTADDKAQHGIFEISTNFGDVRKVYSDGYITNVLQGRDEYIFVRHALDHPKDIYAVTKDGSNVRQLTDINADELAEIQFGEPEQFSFKGWNDETVHGYLVKPWNLDEQIAAGKKVPVALIIHGGPQSAFGNIFHYRWNSQLFAAQGYAVVLVDFHGTPGYGQKFVDSINQDWGGKPLEDIQKGFAHITQANSWMDGNNACALGASYGGYMINWIAGNWNDKFKCLVNHAGLFDMKSMYYSTEELWFPEYDFGGSPTENPEMYDKFTPSNYVQNWQTPMMVLHGLKDFRVPYAQALGSFTALQRNNVPSRLVVFPTENHWILTKKNLVRWYDEVGAWMNKWTSQPAMGVVQEPVPPVE